MGFINEPVATIEVGATKALVVRRTRSTSGNYEGVDLRWFFSDGEMQDVGTENERPLLRPGNKGLSFPASMIDQVIGMLEKAKNGGESAEA